MSTDGGQTDRQTDGQGKTNITPPKISFAGGGGIIKVEFSKPCGLVDNSVYSLPDFQDTIKAHDFSRQYQR